MNRYIKVYKMGYEEGVKEAFNDSKNNKLKVYKNKCNKKLLSNIYDIGYIEGYKIISNVIKKSLYFNNKI